MAFDKFQDCFCGCGRKIKYCAPKELLHELEALQRQIDGEQLSSALQKIEQLEKKFGAQSTLFALKCDIVARRRDTESATAYAKEFVEKFPDNPNAHAYRSAAEAMSGNWDVAMSYLQHALERSGDKLTHTTLVAFQYVQIYAPVFGHLATACGMGEVLASLLRRSETFEEMVRTRQANVTLALKHAVEMPLIANETPWAEAARPAFEDIGRLRWRRALTTLASLSRQYPKDAQLKLIVARLLMQLGSPPEKIADQFREYLGTPGLDYVAQVVGQIYRIAHEEPTSDVVQTVYVVFEVDKIDAWLEQLTASKRMIPERVQRDPNDASPPPRALFQVLDRELVEDNKDLGQAPQVVGALVLYGKQTDRSARLEFQGLEDHLPQVREFLSGLLPLPEPVEEPTRVHAEMVLLRPPVHPDAALPDLPAHQAIQQACLFYYTETLADRPLDTFGGKTLAEAAQDPRWQPLVEAYLTTLETDTTVDLREVRERLQLPNLQALLKEHTTLPLVLLGHADVGGMSGRVLDASLFTAMTYGLALPLQRLIKEACGRDNADGAIRYQNLRQAAMSVGGADAMEALEKAIAWCEAAGDSPGMLQVDRFVLALGADDPEKAQEAFQQATKYTKEPEVASRLGAILNQLDQLQKQIAGGGQRGKAPAPTQGSGLWTPDGAGAPPAAANPAQPAGEASKSKLWLPGQD